MRLKIFAATLLIAAPLAAAEPKDHHCADLTGEWRLDLSSMSIPPAARPLSVTVDFGITEDGIWQTRYLIVAPDGGVRSMSSRALLDGTAVEIEGDQLEADLAALACPAPGVLVMGLSKDGRPGSVRVYTLDSDGDALTESAANVGDDGRPFLRSFIWRRNAD